MASVSFQIDGREVSETEFTNDMMREIQAHAARDIAGKLEGIRCKEHGKAPVVTVVHNSNSEAKLEVRGDCCEGLKSQVEAALSDMGGHQQTSEE